jgi:predicted permease
MSLRRFFRRNSDDQELQCEIEAHFQHEVDDNLARGMSPQEARRRAQLKFGSAVRVREELWQNNTVSWFDNLQRNIRYTVRGLRRSPGFAAVAILVIALGIGATTSLFTVVRSVLLKPLPFRDSSRLIRLYEHSADDKFPFNQVAPAVFTEWKKQSHEFSDLAAFREERDYGLSGTNGQLPENVRASECTWNLFPTLGVEPTLGRGFTASDDQLTADATVILSWGLWQRRFGGDSAVLGQTIHLDRKPYTVIGVMPPWFAFPQKSTQFWVPVHHEESPEKMSALGDHQLIVVGRLAPGATEKQATAELALVVRHLHDAHLENPFIGKSADSRPLLEYMVGDVETPLYVLLAATACVLLIACLNVANLLVARSAARRKELAIRAALGGSRSRLLGEHLTESFLVSLLGGGVGLLLAYAAVQWLVATRQDLTRVEAIHIDGVVVVFALGLVLLCALFAGAISSVSVTGDKMLSSLQESSRSNTASTGRVRLRKWLLVAEVGLTVVLLIAAGLLLKSYQHLRESSLGCITKNVLTMHFGLPPAKYGQPAQIASFFEALLPQVRALPGVQAAALGRDLPGEGYGGDGGFLIPEHPPLAPGQAPYAMTRWVDPGYFAGLGIPFLRGQTFDPNQLLDKANEVVISESFARTYFGDEDPIGKHITRSKTDNKIVGIVGDTRYDISLPAQPMMYFPLYDGAVPNVTLAIRSTHDVTSLALPVQQIIQQMDAELPVSDVLTMDQIIGNSTLDASFDATLVLAFAVLSLLLAAVGLFGVLSYIVAQRTTEIGVRIALGAQRPQVLRLVLADGLWPAGIGLLLGIAGGIAASQEIRTLLYGVEPLDVTVYAAVAALLMLVACLACLLPAWRASRLDPIQALRVE